MSAVRISIVVPSYNGSRYILALKENLLNQEIEDFECIFIDDGSTDDTKLVFQGVTDPRFRYYYQPNAGVSAARNKGLGLSVGAFTMFFDVDDIMPPGFLKSRLSVLEKNEIIDFVSGPVVKIAEGKPEQTGFRGAGTNGTEEIMLYDQSVVTCPSNYLFRSGFLRRHQLSFNSYLSSTADRYFLLTCYKKGHGMYNEQLQPLYYRIHPGSMSANLTLALVKDNDRFYRELDSNALIPAAIRQKSLLLGMFILAASYFKVRQPKMAFFYTLKGFRIHPLKFMGLILKQKL